MEGYGDTHPKFRTVRAQDGETLTLTLRQMSFYGNETLINFTMPIELLNIDKCIVNMLPTSEYSSSVYIEPTNNDAKIAITSTILGTHETLTDTKIVTKASNTELLVKNCSLWQDLFFVSNFTRFEFTSNLVFAPFVDFSFTNTKIFNNTFVVSYVLIDTYLETYIYDNSFSQSSVRVYSTCPVDGCSNSIIIWNNIFQLESSLSFHQVEDSAKNKTLTVHLNSFVKNGNRNVLESTLTEFPIDAHHNWFDSSSGPDICSNPIGSGARISSLIDYGDWCTNLMCTRTSGIMLQKSTYMEPCNTYNKGTIASIVIFTLIFIAIGALCAFVFFFKYANKVIGEEGTRKEIRILGLMSIVFTFLMVLFPIVVKGMSARCVSLVPSRECIFTQEDSGIASLLIFLWLFVLASNAAMVYLSNQKYLLRISVFSILAFCKSVGIIVPFVLIISIMVSINYYLSSKAMVVGLIMLLLSIGSDIFSLVYLIKLKSGLKALIVIVEDEDISAQKSLLKEESETPAKRTIEPDGVFILSYAEYQSSAQTNYLVEGALLGLLVPFSVWYTVYYNVSGALTLFNIAMNTGRIVYGMWIAKRTKLYSHHDIFFILSLLLVASSVTMLVFYCFIIFLDPGDNVSIYFIMGITIPWLFSFILSAEKARAVRENIVESLNGTAVVDPEVAEDPSRFDPDHPIVANEIEKSETIQPAPQSDEGYVHVDSNSEEDVPLDE